jgi:hypothetical protein
MLKAAFAFLAVIVAATLFINVIRLIAWIVLIGCVTTIVVILITWALAAYHYRKAERRQQALAQARPQPAVSSGYTPIVQGEPAAGLAEIALLGRVLSQTEERIARQFAQAVAEGQDQAAINELISKVLRGKDT